MKRFRALLQDRQRAQRGSVLSGVLILTAFIAIVSGALMTELSTSFLLSHIQVNRINNEATVNSALELAVNQLQTTNISSGCPNPSTVTLNGLTAAVSYLGCVPVIDSRSSQSPTQIVSSSPFSADGTHSVVTRANQDLYVVGDSAGNVYQFPFGQSSPNWSWQEPNSSVTGPAVTVTDMGGTTIDMMTLVPLNISSNRPPSCQSSGCVVMLGQDVGYAPDVQCFMGANGIVSTQAALGVNFPTVAFIGDHTGSIFAYTATQLGNCAYQASAAGTKPVVAGPLVFAGPVNGTTMTDEVYVVVSDAGSSLVVRYTYTVTSGQLPKLTSAASLSLAVPNTVGIAIDRASLPARVAITFAGGQVSMVQLRSDFTMQVLANAFLPSPITGSPYWCHCPGGVDRIAVAGTNGGLYVLDAGLGVQGLLPGGGPAVATTPSTDGVGDWFFGATDGYVHEIQQPAGSITMTEVARFGQIPAPVTSSVQVGGCPAGVCVYLGAQNGGAYLVRLDARDVQVTACISTSPPTCSGANPRLWAQIEVGAAGRAQTVHIQGWSYYSP